VESFSLRSWVKSPQISVGLAVVAIALLSIATRFWRLDGLAETVFDEVYYPKFAQNYLNGQPLFDAHPPLGKYMIALGIQIFGYNPFGYRFMTALAGSLVPPVTFGLAYRLDNWQSDRSRIRFALLAGLFTGLDGLLLVESRYGLINIYLVLFGLLSQLCLVVAFQNNNWRWLWVLAAGVMFGATLSVKWSGLPYVVGWMAIALIGWVKYDQRLSLAQILIGLLGVPVSVYLLIWVPHLMLNPEMNLLELHQNIFAFHQSLGVGKTEPIHPYCSSWWTWLLMIRPMSYFYTQQANGDVIDVVAMGNPFLYWLSAIAIALCSLITFWSIASRPKRFHQQSTIYYLLASFAAMLLPWSLSKRCTFIYHYMPASVFGFMAIALVADWCLQQDPNWIKNCGKAIPAIAGLGFIYWLPLYLGLPVNSWQFRLLMWFPSWI
jgi:dolichyl-phosphate-mannose-protein mannosyltransferase